MKSIGWAVCNVVSDWSLCADSNGVCFVPAFNGLQAPINDDYAAATLIGIRPSTSKAHIIRALLESLAYRVRLLYDTELEENSTPLAPEFRYACTCLSTHAPV